MAIMLFIGTRFRASNLQGGFADTTIEDQLHGSRSNGSHVYFGCRLFGTKGASKSASQIIDYSKPMPVGTVIVI